MAKKKKTTKKKARRKAGKKAKGKAQRKVGRPELEIDWEEFDKLCALDCTLTEIAGWFGCSDDTIVRRVKNETGLNFAGYHSQKRGKANAALRRVQMQAALGGNITMMIWLGKNRLGQTDKHDYKHGGGDKPIGVQVLKIGDRLIEF